MSSYLIIDILILLGPLLLTALPQTAYWKKVPAVLITFFIVGGVYILGDLVAAKWGVWHWNPEHISGIRVQGLPIEELLFFFVTTYSCLYIYEVVIYLWSPRRVLFARTAYLILINLTGAAVALTLPRVYATSILLLLLITISLCWRLFQDFFSDMRFWIYLFSTFIPFLLFNYVLTSLPILIYNPNAIIGWRILTIPVEDFAYSFTMVVAYVVVYRIIKRRMLGETD